MELPAIYLDDQPRIALIAQSYARLIGRPLVTGIELVAALWTAPQAILAHDTCCDPVFFFGNRAALMAFETSVEAFLATPSRLSAEAPLRAQRAELLQRVRRHGFIEDYAGVRISVRGRRFAIAGATVWELIDAGGVRHGQAACFAV